MKAKLDIIWNDRRIACPNHLARWNTEGVGYSRWKELGLWWSKGTLRKPKGKKPKGKSFTWLCRNYGLYYRVQRNIKISENNLK